MVCKDEEDCKTSASTIVYHFVNASSYHDYYFKLYDEFFLVIVFL